MPSDAKKKREQKKKEAAKAKQIGKKVDIKEEKEVTWFSIFACQGIFQHNFDWFMYLKN